MRLIHTKTLEITEFFNDKIEESNIEYAILSHTWEEDPREVSYQEFLGGHVPHGRMKKIENCCALAQEHNLDWAWIDSCCIDKTSSAELSEAINSMFSWYQRSSICFVFLTDFDGSTASPKKDQLQKCRYWTRGWTLQELLAPSKVHFYDKRLRPIGTKIELMNEISAITSIPGSLLNNSRQLRDFSIAQRMSWAAHRKTTRIEDVAYCLLGIFNVAMPLLYGEGTRSFQRLQETIISQSDDESIFAWLSEKDDERGMLAASPSEFSSTGNIRPILSMRKRPPSTFTSRGLQISYAYPHPLQMALEKVGETMFGGVMFQPANRELRLDCELTDKSNKDYWIGISLKRNGTSDTWYRRDATKLRVARQNGIVRHLYPPHIGYERINTQAFILDGQGSKSSSSQTAFSRYTRPLWLAIAYQVAETFVVLSDLWIVSAIHHIVGIPAPNALVNWAYMTFIWTFTGSNPSTLVMAALFGNYGLDIMNTYPTVNKYLAVSGQAAMIFLQRFFEHLNWEDLDQKELVGRI